MEFATTVKKLSNIHNGTWFKITWLSELPITSYARSKGYVISKIVTSTVRKGIEYSNLSTVKEKDGIAIDFNSPAKHELPWGHWMKGYYKTFIEHTNKNGDYSVYLRVYTSPNKPTQYYMVNGKRCTLEEVKALGLVQPSYWNKNNDTGTMTIKISNIISIS